MSSVSSINELVATSAGVLITSGSSAMAGGGVGPAVSIGAMAEGSGCEVALVCGTVELSTSWIAGASGAGMITTKLICSVGPVFPAKSETELARIENKKLESSQPVRFASQISLLAAETDSI
jgi:hypothetical protein